MEKEVKGNGIKFHTFAELASKLVSSKQTQQAILKNGNQLVMTNTKETLFMDYESSEYNRFYNFTVSKAFGRLTSENGVVGNPEIYNESLNLLQFLDESKMQEIDETEAKILLDTYKFVSDDDAYPRMEGIYFDDGFVVATDGHRLYCNKVSSGCNGKIVPKTKAILEILKKGTDIKITSINGWIVFSFYYKELKFTYFVKAINERFPLWKEVVPKNQSYRTEVPTLEAWKEAYKTLKALKYGDSNRIFITGKPDTDNVTITANGMDIVTIKWKGLFNENLASDNQDTLAINFEYLNDALTLEGLEYIEYSSFLLAFTFYYANGAKVLVMPMLKR